MQNILSSLPPHHLILLGSIQLLCMDIKRVAWWEWTKDGKMKWSYFYKSEQPTLLKGRKYLKSILYLGTALIFVEKQKPHRNITQLRNLFHLVIHLVSLFYSSSFLITLLCACFTIWTSSCSKKKFFCLQITCLLFLFFFNHMGKKTTKKYIFPYPFASKILLNLCNGSFLIQNPWGILEGKWVIRGIPAVIYTLCKP